MAAARWSEEALAWGRSVIGCEHCGDTGALAGFEVKVEGRLAARLCPPCARAWRPGSIAAPPPKPRAGGPRARREQLAT